MCSFFSSFLPLYSGLPSGHIFGPNGCAVTLAHTHTYVPLICPTWPWDTDTVRNIDQYLLDRRSPEGIPVTGMTE
jgi:hypothetical protein